MTEYGELTSGAQAAAAGEADLRAVLDRIGLAQHYPLFQAEELTDVLVLRKVHIGHAVCTLVMTMHAPWP